MTLSPNCLRLIVIVTNYNPRLAIVGMVNTLHEQDFHLLNTIPLAGRTFIAYKKMLINEIYAVHSKKTSIHSKTIEKKSELVIINQTDFLRACTINPYEERKFYYAREKTA